MAVLVNVYDFVHQIIVENARIEYQTDWNSESERSQLVISSLITENRYGG